MEILQYITQNALILIPVLIIIGQIIKGQVDTPHPASAWYRRRHGARRLDGRLRRAGNLGRRNRCLRQPDCQTAEKRRITDYTQTAPEHCKLQLRGSFFVPSWFQVCCNLLQYVTIYCFNQAFQFDCLIQIITKRHAVMRRDGQQKGTDINVLSKV